MEKLPAEVFINIISLLPQQTKLKCIRVCKKWNEIITTSNLYTALVFMNKSKFTKAPSLFNKKNEIGKPVHHLHIESLDMDSALVVSLPKLLPHINH
jgi:hypothetical protein